MYFNELIVYFLVILLKIISTKNHEIQNQMHK